MTRSKFVEATMLLPRWAAWCAGPFSPSTLGGETVMMTCPELLELAGAIPNVAWVCVKPSLLSQSSCVEVALALPHGADHACVS